MSILIVYYSRTKNTQKIGQELAQKLDADVEEIKTEKPRDGFTGIIKSVWETIWKKPAKIKETEKDPKNYDLIIVGTPVWMGTISSPLRAYVEKHKNSFNKLAFFTTQGNPKEQNAFKELKQITSREPQATLIVQAKEIAEEKHQEKLDQFIKKITSR